MFRSTFVLAALMLFAQLSQATTIEVSRVNTALQSYCYWVFDSCRLDPDGLKVAIKGETAQLDLAPIFSYRQEISFTAVNGYNRTIMMFGPEIGHSIESISARRATWGYEFALSEHAYTPTLSVGLSVLRMSTHDTMQYRPDINLHHSETSVRPYVSVGGSAELTKNLNLVIRMTYANHRFGPSQMVYKFGKSNEVGLQYTF